MAHPPCLTATFFRLELELRKKEALLSTSKFSVEREILPQKETIERKSFEDLETNLDKTKRLDKTEEIKRILEKIASERIRESSD